MAVALSTSKRKFHQLLDNLTNDELPPPPTTEIQAVNPDEPTRNESLSKRPRLTPEEIRQRALQAVEAKRAATHVRMVSGEPIVTQSAAAAGGTAKHVAAKEPNYAPWSSDLFLKRLKTFSDLKVWSPKPERISELHWAKRGWVCDGANRVACKGGCEQRVVVFLRPKRQDADGKEIEGSEDYSAEVDEALVEQYEKMITESHTETCLWRAHGCKADIYHLPLARRSFWQAGLKERYGSLLSLADKLPEGIVEPEGMASMEQLKPNLPASVVGTGGTDDKALRFALQGWKKAKTTGAVPVVTCDQCFARVGLWMYAPKEQALGSDGGQETPQLHLVNAHREYCPWRSAESQASTGEYQGLAAWEILQKAILTGRREKSQTDITTPDQERPSMNFTREQSQARAELLRHDRERFAKLRALGRAFGFVKRV